MTMRRVWAAAAAAAIGIGIGGGPANPAAAAPTPPAPSDDQLVGRALALNDLTGDEAMQEKLTELLKDKGGTRRLVRAAAAHQKAAAGDPPFKYNAALVLGKAAHAVKTYDAAEAFYEACADAAGKLESGSKLTQAYDALIDLHWDQKKYKAVEQACQKFLDADTGGDPDAERAKLFVMERLVQAKAKQGDTDEALKLADRLVAADAGGWYFLQLRGWVQREAGKFDDAVATYTEVLDKLDANATLKDDLRDRFQRNVRYVLSGVHVDNKAVDKAADQLQKLIADDPDNPTYHNDLGFIWADHDVHLDKAEGLVRKALELEAAQRKKLLDEGKLSADEAAKRNPAYLDSMGWVLFKLKKYDEAVTYLEQAVADKDDDEGQHLEIWDHLADAYLAVGKTDKAIATWETALTFPDVSRRDIERRKKVADKLKKARGQGQGATGKGQE